VKTFVAIASLALSLMGWASTFYVQLQEIRMQELKEQGDLKIMKDLLLHRKPCP